MALDHPAPDRADSPVKPNIGVFLCKCGKNIGGSVDVDSLAQAVEAYRRSNWSNSTPIHVPSPDKPKSKRPSPSTSWKKL